MKILNRREWDPKAGKRIGEEAVEKAAELLNASPIQSAKMPVVLDEYTAPVFLAMYFRAFSAEAAQQGLSRLKGKLGQKIAVPELTLLDDPHRPGGKRSCFMDSEGFLTKQLSLIENGIFGIFYITLSLHAKKTKPQLGMPPVDIQAE